PDERVPSALEDAAVRTASRGALSTAARTDQRAANISPSTDRRPARLLAAANYAYASGRAQGATALVRNGLPLADTATARAEYRGVAVAVERSHLRAWGLVNLARFEAAQGQETACRDHAGQAL